MCWIDVAMILFSCVAAKHLGLVSAIEAVTDRELPIVNCPRCLSFWCVLSYMVLTGHAVIASVATSFLCSALAPWVKLLMGFTDRKYNRLYDKIFAATEDESVTESDFEESP